MPWWTIRLTFRALGSFDEVKPPRGSDRLSSYSGGRRRVKGAKGTPKIKIFWIA